MRAASLPWASLPALGGAIGLTFAGCAAVGPNFSPPSAHVASPWRSLGDDAAAAPGPVEAANWWTQFNDPLLTKLVAEGIDHNPDIVAAGERILQANAELAEAVGRQFPQVEASGNVVREIQSTHAASHIPGYPIHVSADQLSLSSSWEIDFWGKFRRAVESGQAALASSQFAYEAALVSLTAQIASSYVTLRTDQAQIAVARENLYLQREGLRIAQARYRNGETGELDWRQARSQAGQTESQVDVLVAAERQARDRLAVLVGRSPSEIDSELGENGLIPSINVHIAVGIPRDLLRRRPDVREAEESAAAQSAQIGVAKAALYPAFSLGGSFGVAASTAGPSKLGDLFRWDSHTAEYGPSFTFPVFNHGRLQAAVRVQSSRFRQAVLAYQSAVLQAQQEVEDDRALLTGRIGSAGALQESVSDARRATQLSLNAYREGAADYTTVLSAQQSQLAVENNLALARGNVPLAAIALYTALGGSWNAAAPAAPRAQSDEN